MISVSPTHANAFRAFVAAALNLDDAGQALAPAPFSLGDATTPTNVVWAERDPVRRPNLYCMLREVAFVSVGPTEARFVPRDVGGPNEDLDAVHFDQGEWTVSVQVVSRLDKGTPSHADNAGAILQRVYRRMETTLTDSMRAIGLAPRRRGQILPLSRVRSGSQWESRAAVDLVLNAGSQLVDPSVGFIRSVAGVGTLGGLSSGPGQPGEVPFTATDPDAP